MLKITKASEPITVEQIVLCIYSVPGVGKTTLGFTADKPLLLDFDLGSYRSAIRKDVVQVESWQSIVSMTADDLAPYNTIVVDTAGRALDALTVDIIRQEPKFGRGGALTLQGYGRLKSEFTAWTKLLRSFGKDVVLVAHSDEQHKGDDLIERIDMQGSSKNEVYKSADAMGRLSIRGKDRVLNFSPSDTAFGKNPAGFEALIVPDVQKDGSFLAGIIATTKERLNALTEEQTEAAALLAEWAERVEAAGTAKAINTLVLESQEADSRIAENAKRLIVKRAGELNLEFDKKAKAFRKIKEAKGSEASHEAAA